MRVVTEPPELPNLVGRDQAVAAKLGKWHGRDGVGRGRDEHLDTSPRSVPGGELKMQISRVHTDSFGF